MLFVVILIWMTFLLVKSHLKFMKLKLLLCIGKHVIYYTFNFGMPYEVD